MRKTKIFNINGKDMELPVFQVGDRVSTIEERDGVKASGTIEDVTHGGLFITVQWDKKSYPTAHGSVQLGASRMVDGLVYEQEVHVFRLCEGDAVAAYTLDDAIAWYKELTGVPDEELYAYDDIETISPAHMVCESIEEPDSGLISVKTIIENQWKGEPFIAVSTT